MDVVKQITVLLWVLGGILIAPPVLRYFDIDPKDAFRKVLMVSGKTASADDTSKVAEPAQKKEIDPRIFDELFQEHQPETPEELAQAEAEFKELIAGLERVGRVAPP